MKIIKPYISLMRSGLETEFVSPEQFIEKVGRTCYKSEDKITDASAAKFVTGLISRGHEAMIEHWSLIFRTDSDTYYDMLNDQDLLVHELDLRDGRTVAGLPRSFLRFSAQTTEDDDERYIVSGNMRAWRDYAQACIDIFGYIPVYMYGMIRTNPLFFPEFDSWVPVNIVNDILIPITAADLVGEHEHLIHHDITIKFICDRGVSHEIVRHRTASFAQESTRYCNYSGEKYNSEITVVRPAMFSDVFQDEPENPTPAYEAWYRGCRLSESHYLMLLQEGCTPQQARAVLNNSLKTELIMTGTLGCWEHFFDLRCAPDAHPDIQIVAKMAKQAVDYIRESCGI